jgi:hypothetical protein
VWSAGDVSAFGGVHDITMLYPVTDIAGLNRLSRVILANAAHALAGMMSRSIPPATDTRPALGLSMFGVTRRLSIGRCERHGPALCGIALRQRCRCTGAGLSLRIAGEKTA